MASKKQATQALAEMVADANAAHKTNDLAKLAELLDTNELIVIGWSLDAMIERFKEADAAAKEAGNDFFREKAQRITNRLISIRKTVMDIL